MHQESADLIHLGVQPRTRLWELKKGPGLTAGPQRRIDYGTRNRNRVTKSVWRSTRMDLIQKDLWFDNVLTNAANRHFYECAYTESNYLETARSELMVVGLALIQACRATACGERGVCQVHWRRRKSRLEQFPIASQFGVGRLRGPAALQLFP